MPNKKSSNPFKNDDIEVSDVENIDVDDTEIPENTGVNDESSSNSEIEKLKAENENLKNQYVRLMADFDNNRKRQESERENLLRFGTENALSKMIEVLDNFERAEKSLENIDDIAKYKEGFELLHKQVYDVLTKLGMEQIKAQGEEFDPNFHDAVMRTPTSEYKENIVIAELQKGYKFGDKVLRPALVNVAVLQ